MSEQLQVFDSAEFGRIRVVEIDGQPWFVGKDITAILGYGNGSRDINRHVDIEDHQIYRNGTSEINNRGVTIINESGLYSLILSSKLPSSKKFKRWITSVVIPCIRKTGAYAMPSTLYHMTESPEFTATLLQQLQKEQGQNEALLHLVDELAPKAAYCDLVLDGKGSISTSVIAKEYGMTAVEFNSLLHDLRIQYKVGNTWVLYKPYDGMGYTKTETIIINENAPTIYNRWTQKGRLFLYEKLSKYGILPIA